MSTEYKKKNCLLYFRNKKNNDFSVAGSVISGCASCGYFYDYVACVAYDSRTEISNALKYALNSYENIVIVCPKVMESTLKNYILYGREGEFSKLGLYSCGDLNVFLIFSDNPDGCLKVSDICVVLDKKYGVRYERAFIKTVGAPAVLVGSAVSEIKKNLPEASVCVTEKFGDCKIEIVYDDRTSKTVFDKAVREALVILNDYVYALDDCSLGERLVQLLKLRRLKLSVAESFTGGGIGRKIVEVSGASEVYFEGLNTYSNESKIVRLGVKEETLARYGAVSSQTAEQMAEGLINTGRCDVSISTTGIAGPKSDNTKKPVGLLYICVATPNDKHVYEFNLKGTRESITKTAINYAMFAAYKTIK